MSIDFSKFDPDSASDLAKAIVGEIESLGKDWWGTNSSEIEGYILSLAEAAFQTKVSLEAGTITEKQADRRMHMQEMALESTLKYADFVTAALAQKIVNTAFEIIGHLILKKTNLNLFPELISSE